MFNSKRKEMLRDINRLYAILGLDNNIYLVKEIDIDTKRERYAIRYETAEEIIHFEKNWLGFTKEIRTGEFCKKSNVFYFEKKQDAELFYNEKKKQKEKSYFTV